MLKKYSSILLILTALVIMLGHNFIGHHHHDIEHNEVSHHHHDGHHHDNDTENDTENESEDWRHFFSGLHHGAEGLTFLNNHSFTNGFSKLIPQFTTLHVSHLDFQQVIIDVRQNAPPYISDHHNSHNYLPSGLRAPPIFIV